MGLQEIFTLSGLQACFISEYGLISQWLTPSSSSLRLVTSTWKEDKQITEISMFTKGWSFLVAQV